VTKIVADTDRCVGAGQCVLTAPALFDQDDDGMVIVRVPSPDPGSVESARAAAHLCPAQALSCE